MARSASFLIATALPLLAGCSSTGNTDFADAMKLVGRSVGAMLHPPQISRNAAAAIPFASMGYSIAGGPQALIVLATQDGDNTLWTSSARIVIQMTGGRIQHTVGLPHDLSATAPSVVPQPPLSSALQGPFSSNRLMDFADLDQYSVAVSCRTMAGRPETITILGHGIATIKISETCTSPMTGWHFTDLFWLTKDGFVWRTLQYIHPKLGPVRTEIFRPPG